VKRYLWTKQVKGGKKEGEKENWKITFRSSHLGNDATEAFEHLGHSDVAREMLKKYYIGELDIKVKIKGYFDMGHYFKRSTLGP
jgi:hypothetical protein